MDITIIGTGNMARGIATRALAGGHTVTLLGTSADKAEALAGELSGDVRAGTVGDSLSGDIVVLAVWLNAANDVIGQYGDQLDGKVVVDITNAVDPSTYQPLNLEAGSAAQEIAASAPGAKVVKAFNTTFAGTLLGCNRPRIEPGGAATRPRGTRPQPRRWRDERRSHHYRTRAPTAAQYPTDPGLLQTRRPTRQSGGESGVDPRCCFAHEEQSSRTRRCSLPLRTSCGRLARRRLRSSLSTKTTARVGAADASLATAMGARSSSGGRADPTSAATQV